MSLELNVCPLSAPATASTRLDTNLDLNAIKQRQQATWASGDFVVISTTLPGPALAPAMGFRAAPHRTIRAGCEQRALRAARVQFSLSIRRPLDRGVPPFLRADPRCMRGWG